ncbi:MAG TPA: hypothetical protein VFA26_01730, partial [Gemmataceae bacterium]|nr:hypothetical protein [Gemmataceae bacterium]
MSGPLHTVHVRVTDAATGRPTPVRLRITDAEGNYYAPFGRLTEFATGPNQDVGGNLLWGTRPCAYVDGACEVNLPAGPLRVEIHKGPEYRPLHADVTLGTGQIALRFTVERWANLRAEGWFPGDARCHFLAPHAALLEAQAEDLAVVNLLVTPCEVVDPFQRVVPALPNLLAFSGQ